MCTQALRASGLTAAGVLLLVSTGCRTAATDDGTGLDLLNGANTPGDAAAGLGTPEVLDDDGLPLDANALAWYGGTIEVCDGADNDGDGHIDEGFADTDHDGTADCVDDEECDGLDNDGDGYVDDGLICDAGETCAVEYAATGHAVWLPGIATNLLADGQLVFTENEDGTATLTGTVFDATGSFDVDVTFTDYSGPTEATPSGSPKLELGSSAYVSGGGSIDPSTWAYFGEFSGILKGDGGYAGAEIELSRVGPAFQTGEGANGKDADDGGSGWFDFTVTAAPSGASWPTRGQGDFNVDFVECESECIDVDLGVAGDYNVFVCESYRFGVDVRGGVAVGDRLEMSGFSVGEDNPGGAVIVADRLVLSSGTVYGDAYYGDYQVVGSDVNLAAGGSLINGMPIDFETECDDLEALSLDLSDIPANGTTTVYSWKGVELVGTHPDVNVFDVARDDLWAAVQFDINAPAGSYVIINVPGTEPKMQEFGIFLSGGVDETTILWNFYEAEKLVMGGIGIRGTILAPTADTCFDNGNFDGTLIVKSLGGDAEGHWFPFDGPFEVCLEDDDGDGIPDGIEL